jgi:hypothetical protein
MAAGQQLGDVVDGGLLAVHDAETVGDVGVGEGGELARRTRLRSASTLDSSAGLKRTFSSRTTSPSASAATAAWALSPTVSPARVTGWPEQLTEPLAATGAREYFSSTAPLGRPRWAHTTTRAPASVRALMVGTEPRIRPSSVIVLSVERDVEIAADEDALAAQVAQIEVFTW